MSSRNTLGPIGSLLTSDRDDEVLFIKVYSLKQTASHGGTHAKPDQDSEMAAGDTIAFGRSDLLVEFIGVRTVAVRGDCRTSACSH